MEAPLLVPRLRQRQLTLLLFARLLGFFSSSVYTGKTADPLTERLRVELESLRQTVDEKERASERDAARGDTYDLLRRGLMANAGQSASGSFCVGGNPL